VQRVSNPQDIPEAEDHPQKKTKRFREQKPEQVEQFLAELAKCACQPIVYVDETGIDTWLCREYGWSGRGIPVIGEVCGRKYERVGIVAAHLGKAIIEPYQYEGTMESSFFEAWFTRKLLPALPESSVIVMDNATFHRKSRLCPLAEEAGHRMLFLPPYSPELNPIENFWSWLKRQLQKILPDYSTFSDALCSVFEGR
jgi:transposase